MNHNLLTILPKSSRYVLVTHVEPDFDAIGSMLGLSRSMRLAGYSVTALVETIPFFMQSLPGIQQIQTEMPDNFQHYDIIALDSASKERIFCLEWLQEANRIINIDHHQDNPEFGDVNLIDTKTSSTSEFLYNLLTLENFPMDESVIIPFYAGILYDTGGFRYSNTSPETLLNATRMMLPYPKQIPLLSEMVFSKWNGDSFTALSIALQNTEYWINEKVCFSAIPYNQCSKIPALAFEGIVDILRLHYCAQMILFLREIEPGVVKGSLRSKPPYAILPIAKYYHGGGHLSAAGFIVRNTSLESIRANLKSMVQAYFSKENEL